MLVKSFVILYFLSISFQMCSSICYGIENKNHVISTNLIKILNDYQEILGILFNLPLNFSLKINDISEIFMNFSTKLDRNNFSLICLISGKYLGVDVYYFEFLFLLIIPILVISGFLLLVKFTKKDIIVTNLESANHLKKNQQKSVIERFTLKHLIFCFVIITLWYNYINIITLCFQMIASINVGDEFIIENRLASKFSIRFDDFSHKIWIFFVSIPILLVFGVGYPLFLILKLRKIKKSKSLDASKNLFQFGFIYFVYQKNLYFWDLFVLLRKVLITVINIVFIVKIQSKEIYPLNFIMFILFISLILQLVYKPYNKEYIKIYELENLSLMSLIIILFLVQTYLGHSFVKKQFSQFFIFIILSIGIINLIYFFYFWAKLYSIFYILPKINSIKNFSQKISKVLKNIKKKIHFTKPKNAIHPVTKQKIEEKKENEMKNKKNKNSFTKFKNISMPFYDITIKDLEEKNLREILKRYKILLDIIKIKNIELDKYQNEIKLLKEENINIKKTLNNEKKIKSSNRLASNSPKISDKFLFNEEDKIESFRSCEKLESKECSNSPLKESHAFFPLSSHLNSNYFRKNERKILNSGIENHFLDKNGILFKNKKITIYYVRKLLMINSSKKDIFLYFNIDCRSKKIISNLKVENYYNKINGFIYFFHQMFLNFI